MRVKRGSYRRWLALLLVVVCTLSLIPSYSASAALPKYNAKPTAEKVLALLKAYDEDGYLMVKAAKEHGEKVTSFYSSKETLLDGIEVTVHELCHSYSAEKHITEDTMTYSYHADTGKDQTVTFDTYHLYFSNEMARNIPASLRDRWITYVGDPSDKECAANQFGVFGLLDEFNAYGWGLHNDLCMYNYLKDTVSGKKAKEYLNGRGGSNIAAYYEFLMWFYMYMSYAKTHYPDVYAAIGNNQEFITAFQTIKAKNYRWVKQYKKIIGDYGAVSYRKLVLKELAKEKYKEVDAVLKGSGVDVTKYTWKEPLDWTSLQSYTFDDNGISLIWRKTKDADGYEVYRKKYGGSYKLLASQSENTYVDKNVGQSGTYYYYIVPFQEKEDGTILKGKKSVTRSQLVLGDVKIKSVSYRNHLLKVTWEKASDSRISRYEVSFSMKAGGYSYTDGDETTTSEGENTITAGLHGRERTSYEIEPPFGKGKYTIQVRGVYIKNGKEYYTRWSKKKTITVK